MFLAKHANCTAELRKIPAVPSHNLFVLFVHSGFLHVGSKHVSIYKSHVA